MHIRNVYFNNASKEIKSWLIEIQMSNPVEPRRLLLNEPELFLWSGWTTRTGKCFRQFSCCGTQWYGYTGVHVLPSLAWYWYVNRLGTKTGQPPERLPLFSFAPKQLSDMKIGFSEVTDQTRSWSERRVRATRKLLFTYILEIRQKKPRAKGLCFNRNAILLIMGFPAWRKPEKGI